MYPLMYKQLLLDNFDTEGNLKIWCFSGKFWHLFSNDFWTDSRMFIYDGHQTNDLLGNCKSNWKTNDYDFEKKYKLWRTGPFNLTYCSIVASRLSLHALPLTLPPGELETFDLEQTFTQKVSALDN